MKQRIIALLLVLALTLSVCAVSALAGEESWEQPEEQAAEMAETAAAEDGGTEEEAPEDGAESAPPSLAGPDAEPEVDPETGEPLPETEEIVPDELGSVTFANVERRMRENNLQVLILEESVQTIQEIDYDDLYEDLRQQLNSLAKTQWSLVLSGSLIMSEYEKDKTYDQLDQAYDAVREQFDAIKDGEMQKDNADAIRQLKNLQDQIIVAGEATYVALAAMETQETALQRQLEALNRTVEEMELRYQLGQVSALQLSQTKAGRESLVSGLETLRMNIKTYKYQLEMLLGAEQTGEIKLGPVPEVTEKQLAAMDLEADLLAAKEKSWELHDAANTLEDAKEDFKDNYSYGSTSLTSKQALHTWNAAQYTYSNTVQNYELNFRALYAQVLDNKQILDAAKVSLACEQEDYAAMELKYRQGSISKNALLSAEDELRTAEETVKTSANNLFSSYNNYCWAVQHGILN
nr:TolC family protein [uncultured Dysosmobacter sp.]